MSWCRNKAAMSGSTSCGSLFNAFLWFTFTGHFSGHVYCRFDGIMRSISIHQLHPENILGSSLSVTYVKSNVSVMIKLSELRFVESG